MKHTSEYNFVPKFNVPQRDIFKLFLYVMYYLLIIKTKESIRVLGSEGFLTLSQSSLNLEVGVWYWFGYRPKRT